MRGVTAVEFFLRRGSIHSINPPTVSSKWQLLPIEPSLFKTAAVVIPGRTTTPTGITFPIGLILPSERQKSVQPML